MQQCYAGLIVYESLITSKYLMAIQIYENF